MISYDEALKIAKSIEPEVATAQEFSDAWYFTVPTNR